MINFIQVPRSSKSYASESNAKKAILKACGEHINIDCIIVQREDLRYCPVVIRAEKPYLTTQLADAGFYIARV